MVTTNNPRFGPTVESTSPVATGASPPRLDLGNPRFMVNPYPAYARMRTQAPVVPARLPDGREAWFVFNYADAALVLRDNRFGKDRRRVSARHDLPIERLLAPLTRSLQFNLLDLDAPDHTRLRSLVHKAFTPRLIEQLRERIQSLADQLIDRALQRGQMIDLVEDYALPIPATVIADLLGVPAADRHKFHGWSSRIVSATSTRDFVVAVPYLLLFIRYLKRLFAMRRVSPREDLITALVHAEQSGEYLSSDELISMVFLLLIAGHETTVNLISVGTLDLLEHSDQLERLRREPELLERGTAIEELLRYTSPVQIATERYALEPVELSGVTVPYGALVLGVIGSANHDEHQFAEPERLDLGRAPNPHLAFGQGIHYCLGAPLARLEAQIAFETLLCRVPDLRLAVAPEALAWRRGVFLRGLRHLPVRAG